MAMTVTEPEVIARLRAAGCVFAEDEARLLLDAAQGPDELERMVAQRVDGLPLEQVVGWAEFCGLRIVVEPTVFVPRRRSEFLAGQAIAIASPRGIVIDLCCGAGGLGAAVLAALPEAHVYAADIDPAAVHCARRNLPADRVFEGDLFDPLPATLLGRVGILVVNAPYVPTDEIRLMPPEARIHEARVALDGGVDGVDIQRRVAAEAPAWLSPGGSLLIETSRRQAPLTVQAFESNGLVTRVEYSDERDATVVIGTKPIA